MPLYKRGISGVTLQSYNPNALLWIGDSTAALNSVWQPNNAGNALNNYQTNGQMSWAQVLLGDYRWHSIHYRGRSGIQINNIANNTASEWHIDKILASSNAKYVAVAGGINDMRNIANRTAEQIRDDTFKVVDKCMAQGRDVHVCSIIPPRSDDTDLTEAFRQRQMRANKYIQQGCIVRGIGYIPLSEWVTDWSNSAVYSRSISPAVVTDFLHANNLGGYIQGKLLKAYWLPLRQKLSTGPIHYTNNAKLDDATLQLLPNPMFNTDADWYRHATAYGSGANAPVYTIVPAPDGRGKAWQIDVLNTPANTGSNTFLINTLWDNTPEKMVAGRSITSRVNFKIEGVGGAGNPVNVYHPWAFASATGGNYLGASACLFGMPGNQAYIPESYDGVLEGPPCRFSGLETSKSSDFWAGVRCDTGASFRLTLWNPEVALDVDQYRTYPRTWTDSDTPVAPTVY